MTPEQRDVGLERVDFRALRYANILSTLRSLQPAALMCMVSPPDADGMCSLGTTVGFIADLWRSVPIHLAHIKPSMPRTAGDPGIPFAELTAWMDASSVLLTQDEGGADATATAIAGHVLPFIRDGATIQSGLGKIPGAVMQRLASHRSLRLHSGLIGDGALDLFEAGALDGTL